MLVLLSGQNKDSMQPILNILINSARKASKFLQRDFLELEMLQSSTHSTDEFCSKSYQRTKKLLQQELHKYFQYLIFSGDQIMMDNREAVLLINPLDSISNLANSIPFFCCTITYLKKTQRTMEPIHCLMNFPILGEIYYSEKGGGVWVEKGFTDTNKKVRLRISAQHNIDKAIMVGDDIRYLGKMSKNIRYFGSSCYDLACFIAGKVDIICNFNLDPNLKYGFELMIKEAGGIIMNDSNNFIAANFNLAKKFKQLAKEVSF